jgi:non-heme chloroperoxidase
MRRSSPRRRSAPIRVVTQRAASAPEFHHVRLSTGVRVRYLEQGPRAGRPVIVLHGLADTWFSFSRVVPGLAVAHRVFALDLRGHGASDRAENGYTPADMAADVVAFMDALGIRRATVVGHSMGSFVGQHVALAAPGRVSGLVLIGSATAVRNEVTLQLKDALAALPDAVPDEFAREFQASTVHGPVPAEFMAQVVADCRTPPTRVLRAALDGLLATARFEGLRGEKIPALLIWGDRDGMFSRADQEALVAALPIASLRIYRDAGHAPHWERPTEIVRDVSRFIRGTS